MDPTDNALILKRIRFGALGPSLQEEVLDLAGRLGYEATITASSSLYFLFKLYKAEGAKEKNDAKALKQAEDMILRLNSLHHAQIIRDQEQKRRSESGRFKVPRGLFEANAPVSEKARKALGSVGITKDVWVQRAAEALGEERIVERAELARSTRLGEAVVKGVFGSFPEAFITTKDADFIDELSAMETKKDIIDSAGPKSANVWVDYHATPGILLDDYHDIQRQLNIEIPPEWRKKTENDQGLPKYIPRTLKKREMQAVLGKLGFALERKGKELVYKNQDGRVLVTSDLHGAAREYGKATVRSIIGDIGITPNRFEEARQKVLGRWKKRADSEG
ncbi:MAG: type II toxin-antitoxin system HicA family toxin [Candidatus Micrarchaeota archaeon]